MELTEQKSEERRDLRNWLILLFLALLLSCSCVLLSTNLALYFLSRPRTVPASLLASSEADYGPDNYQTRLPAPNPSVIAIALTDEAGLQVTPIDNNEPASGGTPIALVTATPLPPPLATGVSPTATAVPPTTTPTPSTTLTHIPTASPSATTTAPSNTPTSTFAPTATPTVLTFFTPTPTTTSMPAPTNTNTPPPNNPSPSRTPTPVSATATSTFTPIPVTATSTFTPIPATATSTFTPIPATATSTFTPVLATATSTFTPIPATATSTFTPVPATATSTFTPIPATATSTFTPVPPTPTPTFTPVPTREALLVVADPGSLNSTDTAVQNRLIALSFTVILADDNTIVEGDTLNRELVIISDSVSEGALGTTLCDARAPTIVAKAALYDEMNMVASGGGNNGSDTNQTNVDIVDPAHPMAAGLSGSVVLLTGSNNMGWGITKPGVQQVASIAGDSSRSTIFAYPASAVITCSGLPIRRVGFPLAAGATLTLDGWRLFDAAVNWIVP